jgi:hyperosmotically inducible protein
MPLLVHVEGQAMMAADPVYYVAASRSGTLRAPLKLEVTEMRGRAILTIAAVCLVGAFATQVYGAASKPAETRIQREVRHELVTLSRYTVFDNIAYRVDGTQVTLLGQVVQPVLKDDAGKAVKGVEGVTKVDNQIEVLPLSPMDDGIRMAVFKAIYGDPNLSRYGLQAVPSIHIIVKNGEVTLEGAVMNDMDKEIANLRASSVGGVFAVTNHLRVDSGI